MWTMLAVVATVLAGLGIVGGWVLHALMIPRPQTRPRMPREVPLAYQAWCIAWQRAACVAAQGPANVRTEEGAAELILRATVESRIAAWADGHDGTGVPQLVVDALQSKFGAAFMVRVATLIEECRKEAGERLGVA